MGDALTSLVAFVVAISVLVAIHEFGHYIVGRWTGMKVLRFSIGFGKPILTWTRGADQTEYCISAIPLGGYVRFLDGREGPVDPEDEGRAFNHRPIWARIAVLFAGPGFNFLFAILAYWMLFVSGIPTLVPAVGEVEADSYAAQAGLQTGDKIIAVGDVQTDNWEAALVNMLDQMVSDGRVPLTLESDAGRQRNTTINVGDDATRLTEPGLLFDGLGFKPFGSGDAPAIISSVADESAASRAGLDVGDQITSIDGESVTRFGDLQAIVSARANEFVEIEYERAGRTYRTETTIGEVVTDAGTFGQLGVTAATGLADYVYLRKFGPLDSIGQAAQRTWSSTIFTVRMLGRMVTGDVSIKNISGPINIAQFAGDSAQRGLNEFLAFLALVSISLGVLNLLPVPVLDGGQIVYQTVEMLKGSPMSERSQIIGQQVGILALILLMSFAFYNDIARILG